VACKSTVFTVSREGESREDLGESATLDRTFIHVHGFIENILYKAPCHNNLKYKAYDAHTAGVSERIVKLCKKYPQPHVIHKVPYTHHRTTHQARCGRSQVPHPRAVELTLPYRVRVPQGVRDDCGLLRAHTLHEGGGRHLPG
jgi:hypothetical protein